MATTQLADIIDVIAYRDLPQLEGPEKTAFWDSGVVISSPLLDELARAAGKTAELPFWNDLDGSEEVNYSNDDPTDAGATSKLTQGEQIARKALVNKGWQVADLASELALGERAMNAISGRTQTYFRRQFQRRLIAATNGVLADNVANDSSDMVHDVAVESIAAQTDATKFNRDAFVTAVQTMGDAKDMLSAIAVHSQVQAQMVRNDDIVYVPDSEGNLTIPTYMGLRVIMDDGLPVVAGTTDGFKYTSVIYGAGAFGYGEGEPEVPVELDRKAEGGNGGGIETLWERKTWILHPFGFKQVGTPAVGASFTLAELATAAVWDRVVDRKLVPMAFLITN